MSPAGGRFCRCSLTSPAGPPSTTSHTSDTFSFRCVNDLHQFFSIPAILAHIATQLLEHIEGPYSLEFLVPVIRLLSQCISPDVLKTVSLESKDALAAFLGI